MILADIFFDIFIFPIEFIIETLFFLFKNIFNLSYSTSIFLLSLSVNFLSLPLYNIAEKWQEKERNIQNKMKHIIDNIKAVYKGDQRYLLIRTCHRINGYKIIYAFRGVLGLLIQIPFFIAAYNFIYSLSDLSQGNLFFIKDFSKPDNLINGINLLPFTMTIFSILAGMVYSKKLTIKESMPLYITSLIFLIILYNSPSGLLFYWNINCLFSLIKNIVLEYKLYKALNKDKILKICNISIILAFIILIVMSFKNKTDIKNILTIFAVIILTLNFDYIEKSLIKNNNFIKHRYKLLILSCLIITVLSGLFIPTSLINNSVSEFNNHLSLIINNLSMSIGIFLFYPLFIYNIFSDKTKNYITLAFIFLSIIFIIDTFIFAGNYPNMNSDFIFDSNIKIINKDIIINIVIILISSSLIYFIITRSKSSILLNIDYIIIFVLIASSIFYTYKILSYDDTYTKTSYKLKNGEKIFNISRNGDNIFVIILDRAIPSYWFDAFNRYEKYKDMFDGFTFYPNTVSYNYNTITIASIYGGYDYLPYEISTNKNNNITNIHNKALLTLPLSLEKYGYKSYMLEPVYANMSFNGDLSIFKSYSNIKAYNKDYIYDYSINKYTNENNIITSNLDNDKLIRFSFFRIIPVWLRKTLYSGGKWLINENNIMNTSIENYALLDSIKDLINIDENGNNYNIMHNNTTHEPHYFLPDLLPSVSLNYIDTNDLKIYKDTNSVRHFYANAASMKNIVKIIDFLKKNNVYDNTKIIIISDHGYRINSKYFEKPNTKFIALYNSLLMYKDFNAKGRLNIDTNFMTVADMPYLAVNHIKDIKNIFNNKIITNDYKTNGANIIRIRSWKPENQSSNTYDFNSYYHVNNNIFDTNNWKFYRWYYSSNYSKERDLSLGFIEETTND